MDNFKFRKFQKLFILGFVLIFIVSSCKKDEEEIPDYVGTWVSINSIEGYGEFTQYKNTLTITENVYTDLGQIYNSSTEEWVDYQKTQASFTISDNIVNSTITGIGLTAFDFSGSPTGEITFYTEDDENFDQLLEQMGQSKTITSEFNVSGNEFVLSTDINGDGDFLDAGETMIFLKE